MPLVRLPPIPARALGFPPKRRVGLLGGSFNPAHAGHRHIADLALKHLGLDEVWFMVSPGNPLKQAKGMAPLAKPPLPDTPGCGP